MASFFCRGEAGHRQGLSIYSIVTVADPKVWASHFSTISLVTTVKMRKFYSCRGFGTGFDGLGYMNVTDGYLNIYAAAPDESLIKGISLGSPDAMEVLMDRYLPVPFRSCQLRRGK